MLQRSEEGRVGKRKNDWEAGQKAGDRRAEALSDTFGVSVENEPFVALCSGLFRPDLIYNETGMLCTEKEMLTPLKAQQGVPGI